MTTKQQAASELLTQFPKAASMTLARMAYKKWPELWPNLDAARKTFRALRGANGERSRMGCEVKEHYREPGKSGDPFGKLPKPAAVIDGWNVVQIDGPAKVLVLSDVHIPYHDPVALRAALQYGRERKADTILLNGDFWDAYAPSAWEKDPRERDLPGELEAMRQTLALIREGFPDADIHYKIGNHEERWERYLIVKAPELLGIADFELPTVLHMVKHNIACHKNCRIRLGRLNVLHGHEYRFSISNPVGPARGLFLRGGAHILCGHFHQRTHFSKPDIEGHLVSVWSTGCLCDLHPKYRPLNDWAHGFAFVEVDKSGAFEVENLLIRDGKTWH